MQRHFAFMLTLMIASVGTSFAQTGAGATPSTPEKDSAAAKKEDVRKASAEDESAKKDSAPKGAAANRNSSGAGGMGGTSTSGAATGGMTTTPAEGTSTGTSAGTSKALPTPEASNPPSRGTPEVQDSKNKEKRKWE